MPPKAQAALSKTAKKNKKKKQKAAAAKQADAEQRPSSRLDGASEGEDDDDVLSEDRLPALNAFPASPMSHSQPLNSGMLAGFATSAGFSASTPFPAATQQELLATANELYRQIETAAAAALATTTPGGARLNGNRTSATTALPLPGDETDDAYWSSLPAHLRSFIKNALPLAAGLSPGSAGGAYASATASAAANQAGLSAAHALNLSPEQMHQAAQQLAQVVQSTGWASLGVPANAAALNANVRSTQSGNTTTTTTTIPLGSFTLPLHPHPDHPRSHQQHPNDAYHELEVDLTDEYSDEEDDDDLSEEELEDDEPLPPLRSMPQTQAKKPTVNSQQPRYAPPSAQGQRSQQPQYPQYQQPLPNGMPGTAINARKQPPAPTRSAVPVVPQLSANHPPNAARKGAPAPANQQPSAVRPANSAAQAQVIRERAQAAAQAQATTNAASSSNLAAKVAANTEREKIRDFWLELSENDRRALVKIEKESVLRKMKEQQKHGCSCAVCGRKRSAIEEELEVLYDAYYEELEQYAFQQKRYKSSNGALPPPPGPGPFPGSVDASAMSVAAANAASKQSQITAGKKGVPAKQPQTNGRNAAPAKAHTCPHHTHNHPHAHGPGVKCNGVHPQAPAKVQHPPIADLDDDDEDEYDEDDEEDDDGYDDEEYDEDEEEPTPAPEPKVAPANKRAPAPPAKPNVAKSSGVLGLGDASLAVKNGGILTVADDLLKNDGQKFLEMMESLADKRIQREREAAEILDDEEGDEDDEDYDDDEDTEDEDEDLDDDEDDDEILTEEQRMSEGRRMFQIFAARMFEQRVLQSYREKVAQERQQQLLMELAAEDQAAAEKDAKKAKDAQKKKDKKKAQKEKAEADRLKREADEKARTDAAAAALLAKSEEDRRRAAEQQRKDEEKRKAREGDLMRKEEEKRKRLEKQEKDAKDKREREERLKAEREAKLQREKEAKAKEREERDRKVKEDAAKKEAARKERVEREAREQAQAKLEQDQREAERESQRLGAASAANGASGSRSNNQNRPSPPRTAGHAASGNGKLAGDSRRASAQRNGTSPNPNGGNPIQVNGFAAPPTQNNNRQQNKNGAQLPPPNLPNGNLAMPPRSPLPSGIPVGLGPGPFRPGMLPMPPGMAGPGNAMPMPSPMYGRPASAAYGGPPPIAGPSQARSIPTGIMSPPGHFGAIGVGPPPNALRSPVPPGFPAMHDGPPGMQGGSSMPSGVAPIGRRTSVISSGNVQSNLAALNLNAPTPTRGLGVIGQPQQTRRISTQDGVRPIGFRGDVTSDQEDDSHLPSASASIRSASPPPILGSAALLEDFDDGPDSLPPTSPTVNVGQSFSATGWGANDGIWGVHGSATGWKEPAPSAQVQELERGDIIRARSGIACLQLNDTLGRSRHSAHDVYRLLMTSYPDSASVDLGELISSCAAPANAVNGGGHFDISREGAQIMLSFDPSRVV